MIFRHTPAIILTACLSANTPVDAATQGAMQQLADIGNNRWLLVDTGGVTAPAGILAYSSGWLETDRGRFCLFGGGHWNYSGNEVWCFDTKKGGWTQLYAPDAHISQSDPQGPYLNFDNKRYPGALFNPAGEPVASARPMSRHTYDQIEYVPGFGAVVWGGYPWGDGSHGWCMHCKDTWSFDSEEATWRYLYNGRNPSPDFDTGVGTSAYVNQEGVVYATAHSQTWIFDPRDASWSRLGTSGKPPYSIEASMEYDPKRNWLYLLGGRYPENTELWRFDIARRSWDALDTSGDKPGAKAVWGPGLTYDSANDVLLVYQSGSLWVYDPATSRWEKPPYNGGPTEQSYVFGRLRYDAAQNGAWLHIYQNGQHQTWFYRYRAPRP